MKHGAFLGRVFQNDLLGNIFLGHFLRNRPIVGIFGGINKTIFDFQ
jgi:hypothetical protein